MQLKDFEHVVSFPVQIPKGFVPSDFDCDGDDIGSSGKVCPGFNPADGYRPRWGGGFRAVRGAGIHRGLDIMAAEGALVCAPANCTVISEGESPKGGHHIYLQDEKGFVWYFSHLREKSHTPEGAKLLAGDVCGYVGRTGNARYRTKKGLRGCPHLHLSLTVPKSYKRRKDIDQNGTKIDPLPILRPLYEGWKQ